MIGNLATLTCQEVVELLTEYLGDGMEADDRILLEQHLLVCPPCTAHLGQLRATLRMVGGLRAVASPVPMAPLLEVFRRATKGKGS